MPNATVICALAAVTDGCPGAFGIVLGMATFDGGDVGPGPLTLLAAATTFAILARTAEHPAVQWRAARDIFAAGTGFASA